MRILAVLLSLNLTVGCVYYEEGLKQVETNLKTMEPEYVAYIGSDSTLTQLDKEARIGLMIETRRMSISALTGKNVVFHDNAYWVVNGDQEKEWK